jgi:Flp pilus assembly protein TadD
VPLLERPLCSEVSTPGTSATSSCSLLREVEAAVRRGKRDGTGPLLTRLDNAIEEGPAFALFLARGRVLTLGKPVSFGEGGEDNERALRDFERALVLEPSSDVAALERARTLLALGRGRDAYDALDRLAGLYPKDAEVRGAFGVCLLASGDLTGARRELGQSVALDPKTPERHVTLGTALFLLGERKSAESSLRAALHLAPLHGPAHGALGALLLVEGRVAEGKAHLERAQKLMPKSAAILTNLSYADYLEGRLVDSERRARDALAQDEAFPSAWLNLGLALAAQKKFTEAREAIRRAEALNPGDPRVRTAYGDLDEAEALEREP